MKRTTCLAICLVLGSVVQLPAQAPDSLSFQGFLTDSEGNPLDSADVGMTFTLYKGPTPIWTEGQLVDVDNGRFDVWLGATTPLDTVKFNMPIDLGVKLDNEASEISPRTPLVSGAFARALPGLYTYYQEEEGGLGSIVESYNLVGGHPVNEIGPNVVGGTIGGGGAMLNGGFEPSPNQVTGDFGTIAGGRSNTVFSRYGGVAGGQANRAGQHASVGGGLLNAATFAYSTISGGRDNRARGDFATVPGGEQNQARASYAFAAGYRARAIHEGSFVWNDRSVTSDNDSLLSTGENQFLIRAAGGVGIGTASPLNQFHVARSISAAASVQNHVAVIDNTSTGSSADVLALRVGRATSPETSNAFISFKYNANTSAGFIRGEGTGGIELVTSGADYAEYLPNRHPNEQLEPGDVVGVFGGQVSKRTTDADQIMVVSTAPIVVGNHRTLDRESEEGFSKIAFIGQAPVRVRGPVHSGDFLMPSGLEDGTARAIKPQEIQASQLPFVFATAWESSEEVGIKSVNAAIGIDQSAAVAHVISALRAHDAEREERIAELEKRLTTLEAARIN